MHYGITALGISQCYIGSFMHSGITALGISKCYIGLFMHSGITALGISQCYIGSFLYDLNALWYHCIGHKSVSHWFVSVGFKCTMVSLHWA